MFYSEYLSQNRPVHVEDGALNWPAMSKWWNSTYLEQLIKDTEAKNYLNEE